MIVCFHDPGGRITGLVCEPIDPAYVEHLAATGTPHVVIESESVSTVSLLADHYIMGGAVVSRPALPSVLDKIEIAADGVDTATLEGLPAPCTVLIDGEAHDVTTGELPLSTDMPGDYKIAIQHWPFLDWTATVRAR